MAKPTKSVWARAFTLGNVDRREASASACCGEGLPKTLVMSPFGRVLVFSSTVLAVATAPKSQPARVYGTQGAGAVVPDGVTMFGTVGVLKAETGSVQ